MPLQLIEENSFAETEHNSLNKQRCRMLLHGPSSFPNPLSYLGSVKVTEGPLGSAKNVFMLGNKLIFSYKYWAGSWGVGEGYDVALTFCLPFVAVVEVHQALPLLQTLMLCDSFFFLYHFMTFFTFDAEDFKDGVCTPDWL